MTTSTTNDLEANRYANALIGLAAGDAWGYQVEFTSYTAMPAYPVAPPAGLWRISDDTQMTLALHDALASVTDYGNLPAVTDAITRHFIAWQVDPDNNRAPGRTCMGSLNNLHAQPTRQSRCQADPTGHGRSENYLRPHRTRRHPRAVGSGHRHPGTVVPEGFRDDA